MAESPLGKPAEAETASSVGIWDLDSPHRALFNVLLAIAVIVGSISHLHSGLRLGRVMMATAPAAGVGVGQRHAALRW